MIGGMVIHSPEAPPGMHRVPAAQLAWLEGELARWQAEGRLDAATVAGIRSDYSASRRYSLSRLLLALGAAFVGIGVLWLVAANLDELSPTTRFVGVVVLWLGAVAAAELLADSRRTGRVAVAALQLVAALLFGAVVMQAAQSLQVPAYDSGLLGTWGAGALLYAYAVGALAPLLVGIVVTAAWWVWVVAERSESVAGAAVALLLAAVLTGAVAVAHQGRLLPSFAAPWRLASALLVLIGLFLAALPRLGENAVPTGGVVWAGVAVVLLAAVGAALVADKKGRLEVGAVVAAAVVGALVVQWQPAGPTGSSELTGEGLTRAVVAILVYLLAAAWLAALGVLRDAGGLTQLATGALVVFTVVQSFAVFEPILSGAALFLVLGVVLAGAGYLVERGRRRLVADVAEASA